MVGLGHRKRPGSQRAGRFAHEVASRLSRLVRDHRHRRAQILHAAGDVGVAVGALRLAITLVVHRPHVEAIAREHVHRRVFAVARHHQIETGERRRGRAMHQEQHRPRGLPRTRRAGALAIHCQGDLLAVAGLRRAVPRGSTTPLRRVPAALASRRGRRRWRRPRRGAAASGERLVVRSWRFLPSTRQRSASNRAGKRAAGATQRHGTGTVGRLEPGRLATSSWCARARSCALPTWPAFSGSR